MLYLQKYEIQAPPPRRTFFFGIALALIGSLLAACDHNEESAETADTSSSSTTAEPVTASTAEAPAPASTATASTQPATSQAPAPTEPLASPAVTTTIPSEVTPPSTSSTTTDPPPTTTETPPSTTTSTTTTTSSTTTTTEPPPPTTTSTTTIPKPKLPLPERQVIANGDAHTCAVQTSGRIYCWGDNNRGQLGSSEIADGEGQASASPVLVSGINDAVDITASISTTCALHSDGSISCWGDNGAGQLGAGSKVEKSSIPIKVKGMTDAIAVSTGGGITYFSNHTCAVHRSGSVYCWGGHGLGDVGVRSYTPKKVTGINDATSVSAGVGHTCVLTERNEVLCWGYLQLEQEDGTYFSQRPVKIPGISNVAEISAAEDYTCALHRSGQISCWGKNFVGTLGRGFYTDQTVYSPSLVKDISNAVSISSKSNRSCAVLSSGKIKCWGDNRHGQLGDGKLSYSTVPVEVKNISNAVSVAVGGEYFVGEHSCALLSTDEIYCWGSNYYGQIGNGEFGVPGWSIPVQVDLGFSDVESITAGAVHACALRSIGTIYCWGGNGEAQIGSMNTFDSVTLPTQVSGISDASSIDAGDTHTCAVHSDGTVSCWGSNYFGQLGNGTSGVDKISYQPVKVHGLTDVTGVTAGLFHSCALHINGTVSCWGWNAAGQLGNGIRNEPPHYGSINWEDEQSPIPVQAVGISDAIALSAGDDFTCALLSSGTVSCWGSQGMFETRIRGGIIWEESIWLGTPKIINDLIGIVGIVSQAKNTCAQNMNSEIFCWGNDQYGQLGNGVRSKPCSSCAYYSQAPLKVQGINDSILIATGGSITYRIGADDSWSNNHLVGVHACSLNSTGTISCWGNHYRGQLGHIKSTRDEDGSASWSASPVVVEGITDAKAISLGGEFSCALHSNGSVSCWGDNQDWQLGGHANPMWVFPVKVTGLP